MKISIKRNKKIKLEKISDKVPCFLIVGSAGHGKTTLIESFGLYSSPPSGYENKIVNKKIAHLNQWSTKEMTCVEINTDHNLITDKANSNDQQPSLSWPMTLDVLKKCKPNKPISGMIIVIDVSIFLTQTITDYEQFLKNLQHYVNDLINSLGSMSIYIILTKCDLIAGFLPYFTYFSKRECEQKLGITFPIEELNIDDIYKLATQNYNHIIRTLNKRLFDIFSKENNINKKIHIGFLPQQLLLLNNILLKKFIEPYLGLFLNSSSRVQGIYFVSSVQNELPFYDQISALIKRYFNLSGLPQQTPDNYIKRSYFIKQLTKEIILQAKKNLYTPNRLRRLYSWSRVIIYGVIISTILFASIGYGAAYLNRNACIRNIKPTIDKCIAINTQLNNDELNIVNTLPLLSSMKDLAATYFTHEKWLNFFLTHPCPKSDSIIQKTLQRIRTNIFLPRIAIRLEHLQKQYNEKPLLLENTLKAYLTLGDPEHLSLNNLKSFLEYDWLFNLKFNAAERQVLNYYLSTLLANKFHPLSLDRKLIMQSSDILINVPSNQKIYLMLNDLTTNYQVINLYQQLTINSNTVFWQTASVSIAPLYTKNGFYEVHTKLPLIVDHVLNDRSFISSINKVNYNDKFQLMSKVNDRYTHDYIKQWQLALNSLIFSSPEDLNQILILTNQLNNPDSPLTKLFTLLSENTNFAAINKEISQYFSTINQPDKQKRILQSIIDLASFLDKIKKSPDINKASFEAVSAILTSKLINDPISKLYQEGSTSSQPIQSWLCTLAGNSWNVLLANSRQHINQIWKNQILEKYKTIENYYPLKTNATYDMNINDFMNFYANGGILDGFFQAYVKPFVDTSNYSWRWISLYGHSLSNSVITLNLLKQTLSAAQLISTNVKSNADFSLRPVTLSDNTANVRLQIDNQKIIYDYGPQQTKSFKWPTSNSSQVQISFLNFNDQEFTSTYNGPWALFKLTNSCKLESTSSSNHYYLTFSFKSHVAKFELLMPHAEYIFSDNASEILQLPIEFL